MSGATVTVNLDRTDRSTIDPLVDQLLAEWRATHDPVAVVDRAAELAVSLPPPLGEALGRFAEGATSPVLLVRGAPVEALAATPGHWTQAEDQRSSLVLLLVGEALGASFGWSTQQEGRLIHDVVPTIGDELVQLGSNSTETLTLHSEDAFHPFRGEWLALMCLRNPQHVATLVSTIDQVELDEQEWSALREPGYPLLADLSHHPSQAPPTEAEVPAAVPEAEDAFVATLGWDEDRRLDSLRFDPYYTGTPHTPRHAAALAALSAELERRRREVRLEPGDLLLLDNHRAVHGRAAFAASYQHDERWLKRVCITGDLRRSRSMRHAATCRIVGCVGPACGAMLDLTAAAEPASSVRP